MNLPMVVGKTLVWQPFAEIRTEGTMKTRIKPICLAMVLAVAGLGTAVVAQVTGAGVKAAASQPTALTKATKGGESAGTDWPCWRGPNHDGTTSETISTNWPKEGPPKLWERQIGHGYSCVIVSGDRVITLGVAGGKESAYCLNAATGAVLWDTVVNDATSAKASQSTPVTDGKVVVAVTVAGRMVAMDIATGKVLWSKSLKEDLNWKPGQYGWGSSPLLHKNLVILGIGLAFNITSGETVWENKRLRNDPKISETYSTPVPFNVEGTDAILIRIGGSVSCLDPDTGVEKWRTANGDGTCRTDPVVIGDKILWSGLYYTTIAKFSAKGAEVVTQFPLKLYLQDCVTYKRHVYTIPCGPLEPPVKDGYFMICFDPAEVIRSGKYDIWAKVEWGTATLQQKEPNFPRKWIQRGGEGTVTWGTMSIAGDHIVHLTKDGVLVIVRATADKFQQVASARLFDVKFEKNFGIWDCPVISHGRLYCRVFTSSYRKTVNDVIACYDVRQR